MQLLAQGRHPKSYQSNHNANELIYLCNLWICMGPARRITRQRLQTFGTAVYPLDLIKNLLVLLAPTSQFVHKLVYVRTVLDGSPPLILLFRTSSVLCSRCERLIMIE